MTTVPVIDGVATETVEASFGRAAMTYWRHANVQRAMAHRLAEWLPELRAGCALELGAGPGIFTEHLLPWGGRLVATDLSAAMCAVGRARVPAADWRIMNAHAPADGPWDWIFSSSMLQWVADPSEVLSAWRSQLASGGRILAGVFVEDTLSELRALIGDASPLVWRSADEWRAAVANSGLRLRRDDVMRRRFVYPSAHALLRSLHAIGAAPQRRLGFARMRKLLEDYDRLHATPGGVSATWAFHRFEATWS